MVYASCRYRTNHEIEKNIVRLPGILPGMPLLLQMLCKALVNNIILPCLLYSNRVCCTDHQTYCIDSCVYVVSPSESELHDIICQH